MPGKEPMNPGEFMDKIQQIYREREDEFSRWEADYQKKSESLQTLLAQVLEDRKKLDADRENLEKEQERVSLEGETLRRDQETLEQERDKLASEKNELVFKMNLEHESIRNEEMKLKRLRDDYEYKISMADGGLSADMSLYMLRTEHREIMDKQQAGYEAQLQELRESYGESLQEQHRELEQLRQETEDLRAERIRLLAENLKLSGAMDGPGAAGMPQEGRREENREPRQTGRVPESGTGGEPEGALPGETKPEEAAPEADSTDDITAEELTAETLRGYMEKNKKQFQSLEILHSDDGEQLSAWMGKLRLRFLFTKPAQFDVAAKRKNSAALRKKLQEMNIREAGVVFQYDEAAEEARATGFFTADMTAETVMEKVERICDCFAQR